MPSKVSEIVSEPRQFAARFMGGAALFVIGFYLQFLYTPAQGQQPPTVLALILMAAGAILAGREWKAVSNPRLALRYSLNPVKTVKELIEEWNPGALGLEKEYEKSLLDHLRSRLRHIRITRQYGTARVKCDLAVGKDVLIELKTNLTSTHKLQRLLGQIQLYTKELDKPVIVLLLGNTDDDLFKDLVENIGANVHLVQKRTVVEETEQT